MAHETEQDIFTEPGGSGPDDDAAYAAALADDNGGQQPESADKAGEPAAADAGAQAQTEEQEGQAAATAAQDTKGQQHPPGYVQIEALHQARHETKELRDQLREVTEKLNTFSGLREELEQVRNQRTAAQQAEEEQAFETDPVGYMRKQVESLQSKIAEREQQDADARKQNETLTEQQRNFQELQRTIATQVTDYIKETPDYPDAFRFLMEARIQEYQALGITDPNEIARAFDQEAFTLAQIAMKQGRNPGAAAYELAKARGYKKADNPAPADTTQQPDAGDTLAAQLDKLERGQKASQTLSGGGEPAKGNISLADIQNMDNKAFDALWDEMSKEANAGNVFDG